MPRARSGSRRGGQAGQPGARPSGWLSTRLRGRNRPPRRQPLCLGAAAYYPEEQDEHVASNTISIMLEIMHSMRGSFGPGRRGHTHWPEWFPVPHRLPRPTSGPWSPPARSSPVRRTFQRGKSLRGVSRRYSDTGGVGYLSDREFQRLDPGMKLGNRLAGRMRSRAAACDSPVGACRRVPQIAVQIRLHPEVISRTGETENSAGCFSDLRSGHMVAGAFSFSEGRIALAWLGGEWASTELACSPPPTERPGCPGRSKSLKEEPNASVVVVVLAAGLRPSRTAQVLVSCANFAASSACSFLQSAAASPGCSSALSSRFSAFAFAVRTRTSRTRSSCSCWSVLRLERLDTLRLAHGLAVLRRVLEVGRRRIGGEGSRRSERGDQQGHNQYSLH